MISKDHVLKFLALSIIFTSWVIFYTIPRDLQYPLLFIPSIFFILKVFHPFKKKNVIAFISFGFIVFRYYLPLEVSLLDISFWATMIRAAFISSIFLIDDESIWRLYFYFKRYLLLIIIISLPAYILHISGVLPIGQISTFVTDAIDSRTWNVYLFFSLQDHPIYGEIQRYAAIFDEPGFLGVMLAFILAIEKFKLNNKTNFVFLVAGLLTFSLAFYLISLIYFAVNTEVKLKYKLITAIVLLLILSGIYTMFQQQFDNSIINRLNDNTGSFIENSGRIGINVQLAIIEGLKLQETNELVFGSGYLGAEGKRVILTAYTWEVLIYQLGLLFTFILVTLIFTYGIRSKERFLFAVLFTLSILHRPSIFLAVWIFLLNVGVVVDNESKSKIFKQN